MTMATQRQRSHTTSDRLATRAVPSRGDLAVSPASPIAKGKFRPVNFSTNVEFDQFFGQTAAQRRELHLHTRDEDGRWWFDEIGELSVARCPDYCFCVLTVPIVEFLSIRTRRVSRSSVSDLQLTSSLVAKRVQFQFSSMFSDCALLRQQHAISRTPAS